MIAVTIDVSARSSRVRVVTMFSILKMRLMGTRRVITMARPEWIAPGDEIRRKDGAVPARLYGKGEIPGNDGMHRDHEGRGKTGHQKVGGGVVVPLFGRSCPSQGEIPVYLAAQSRTCGPA